MWYALLIAYTMHTGPVQCVPNAGSRAPCMHLCNTDKATMWGVPVGAGSVGEGADAPDMSAAVVARHPTKFPVASVAADPLSGHHLAVAGLHDLQVQFTAPSIVDGILCVTASCSVHGKAMHSRFSKRGWSRPQTLQKILHISYSNHAQHMGHMILCGINCLSASLSQD